MGGLLIAVHAREPFPSAPKSVLTRCWCWAPGGGAVGLIPSIHCIVYLCSDRSLFWLCMHTGDREARGWQARMPWVGDRAQTNDGPAHAGLHNCNAHAADGLVLDVMRGDVAILLEHCLCASTTLTGCRYPTPPGPPARAVETARWLQSLSAG